MSSKLLVTGGAGFIGSNLVRYLIEQTDCDVLNFDKLTYAGNQESLIDIESNDRYRFERGDICDSAAVRRAFSEFQPTAVMHLAAESHVDRSIDGPGEFIQTNLVGTFNLLEAARHYRDGLSRDVAEQFRFLHVSTDEVYGSLGFDDDAFHESTPYDPHSPYSATKAGSDHLARAWATTYNLPVVITNCSNNYGPFQFPEKLVPVVILKALRGEEIPIYGKGDNVRDWLYVGDHVKALYQVVREGNPGETYNIGGNNERSNLELVKMMCGILDELVPASGNETILKKSKSIVNYEELITFVSDRPGHDLRYAINAEKIESGLGWKPAEDMTSGFRKTIQWYLDNQQWCERCLSGEYKLQRQGLGDE